MTKPFTTLNSYKALTWVLTALLIISMIPRLFIPTVGFELFSRDPQLGFPITGLIGMFLLIGIAFSIGRGKVIPSLLCYIMLQGTMRRYLITDSGLPHGLVFLDDFMALFLLFLILREGHIKNVTKPVRIIVCLLFGSIIVALISLFVNHAPVLNLVVGFFRSIFENPLWLLILLLVNITKLERCRLFFELSTVILFCHLSACIISAITCHSFWPGDSYTGVYGWTGSNFLSITASIVLFFIMTYPDNKNKLFLQKKNDSFCLKRNFKFALIGGWGFLFVFGASRLGILLTFLLGLMYCGFGILKKLIKLRVNKKYFFVISSTLLFLIIAISFRSRIETTDKLEAVAGAFRSPSQWLIEWNISTTKDVTRGAMLLHNINILNQDAKRWLWGVGVGMYRSSTGSALRAPLVEEAENKFGGRWCAPMYISDGLVEYGIIGLLLILLIPLGTIVSILHNKEYSHPGKVTYFLAILLVLIALIGQSTLEYRGLMLILYFIGSIIFTSKSIIKIERPQLHDACSNHFIAL